MPRVLLSFVGKQDPISERTSEEGSIVTLCRHIRPDIVYQFPTAEKPGIQDTTEQNARDTRMWLADEVSQHIRVYTRPLAIDPASYMEVLNAIRSEVRRVLRELEEAFGGARKRKGEWDCGYTVMGLRLLTHRTNLKYIPHAKLVCPV